MRRTTPLDVGTNKYLLFDDALTEDKRGFVLTMNPAVRDEEPVVAPDRPWEARGISASSVVEARGFYQL